MCHYEMDHSALLALVNGETEDAYDSMIISYSATPSTRSLEAPNLASVDLSFGLDYGFRSLGGAVFPCFFPEGVKLDKLEDVALSFYSPELQLHHDFANAILTRIPEVKRVKLSMVAYDALAHYLHTYPTIRSLTMLRAEPGPDERDELRALLRKYDNDAEWLHIRTHPNDPPVARFTCISDSDSDKERPAARWTMRMEGGVGVTSLRWENLEY